MKRLRSLSPTLFLILAVGLGAAACSNDDDGGPAGKSGGAKRKATRRRAKPGFDYFQKQMWKTLAKKPTECDAGKNERTVKSVTVSKAEEMTDDTYLKARGEATMVEKGPCPGSGTHTWKVSMTFIRDGDDWRPASFGLDQSVAK